MEAVLQDDMQFVQKQFPWGNDPWGDALGPAMSYEARKAAKQSHALVPYEPKEVAREPHKEEPRLIQVENILVLPKQSKVQWDMAHMRISKKQLLEHYEKEGVDIDAIMSAHQAHSQSLDSIGWLIDESQILPRGAQTEAALRERIAAADLVISLGGDDHLKYVSQYVHDTFVIAMNSDPARSTGALISTVPDQLRDILAAINQGEYLVQEWQRIETTLNGNKLAPALSEIYVGERDSKYGSRAAVEYRGDKYTMKGSGLIVSTGAGSTGWYKSASRYLDDDKTAEWPRTLPELGFVQREPYGALTDDILLYGGLKPGEELVVRSSNNHKGELSVDSISDYSFARGSEARFQISESPLKVLQLDI